MIRSLLVASAVLAGIASAEAAGVEGIERQAGVHAQFNARHSVILQQGRAATPGPSGDAKTPSNEGVLGR